MELKAIIQYNAFSFGTYVRRRRQELDLTLRSLASMVGITPAYLSDIENGKRNAPLGNKNYMQKLIEYLKLNEEEIQEFCLMAIATRGYDFSYLEQK